VSQHLSCEPRDGVGADIVTDNVGGAILD